METHQRHGYDLIREIETRTGGVYAPSPGVIYPTLTLLEELDQIQAATSDGSKRAFTLTPTGKAFLGEHKGEVQVALERLDALGTGSRQTEAGPVWRAMQNLKSVLEQRLTGVVDKEMLFQIADIVDDTARKIERLA